MTTASAATTPPTVPEDPRDAPDVSDPTRRNLIIGTAVVGGLAGAAVAWPFLASMSPSERAKAAGAPVEVDIGGLEPGQLMTVEWRGKPVWVLRRTPDMLASLKQDGAQLADPNSLRSEQPPYARNETRSIKPEYLVAVGICTHLGCSPIEKPPGDPSMGGSAWPGGFLCPCHGSRFDLAGRVYANMPAPDNLPVPPYRYVSDAKIVIGEDTKGA